MKILDRIDRGLAPVVHGDGSQAYDFIHVKDCARANIRAMKSTAMDAFFNVGTGIKTTVNELTEMLIQLGGSDLDIQYEASGQTFVKSRIGCTRKAAEELGFVAEIFLEEGLQDLISWRQSHKGTDDIKRKASPQ